MKTEGNDFIRGPRKMNIISIITKSSETKAQVGFGDVEGGVEVEDDLSKVSEQDRAQFVEKSSHVRY